jgi:hypothetical protein
MTNFAKGFSYVIAAHVQSVGLIMLSIWGGRELDVYYPLNFTWLYIMVPVAVFGVFQTFYLILRSLFLQEKSKNR